MSAEYDFSCWLIKYNGVSIYGRVYQKSSIKITGDQKVPLVWNHQHYNPDSILGYAILEEREEGVYVYGTLSNVSLKESVTKMIQDKGSVSISPFVTQIKYDKNIIISGIIREVSLVPERIDPDESYYPVLKESEE